MISQELPLLFGRSVRAIHAVGVGGMGLGPLSIYLAKRGWQITGEDAALTPAMADQLERGGVEVVEGNRVPVAVDLVVCSSAIPVSHAALVAARRRGALVVRRGELLAEVSKGKRFVAVCGSHGKTTTTAMLVEILRSAWFQAGYVLGGLMADAAVSPAEAGENDWLIAEVDESDGTIERFHPEVTVVVNLDWDHPDHYLDVAAIEEAFGGLIARTKETVLVCDSCGASGRVLGRRETGATVLSFGRTGDFRMELREPKAGSLRLGLGGRFSIDDALVRATGDFNALNAAAAFATAEMMSVPISEMSLAAFSGVRRRQTVLRQDEQLTVIEDYAHHPAEIRALLSSLRREWPTDARMVVVFQPHRFSRTLQFKAEIAAALGPADRLYLLDVYAAGEAPRSGGTAADLYAEVTRLAHADTTVYLPGDRPGTLSALSADRRGGDLVVFVGAGDIDEAAREWLAAMEQVSVRAGRWDELANALRSQVREEGIVAREETLANKTTLRVGGTARIYASPGNVEDLTTVVRFAREHDVPLLVLGRGSNLLVPDSGVDGVVVSLRRPEWDSFEQLPDGRIRVGAGLRLKNLCGLAINAGLEGFEFLEGIPGNVGGALRMNAGAMGGWIFDVVDEVELLGLDGEFKTLKRADMHTGYRHCVELRAAIAIAATLRPGARKEAGEIGRQVDVYRSKRQETQPREPSAGCIFKNPASDSAGRLIDVCGLKGMRVGDAEVSTVHGNFIVNRGKATSDEVIELVRRVRAQVKSQVGVELEPEVLLYGADWKEVL